MVHSAETREAARAKLVEGWDHARMTELGKQVRKDDERDRDRTKAKERHNDRDRGGPGR